MGAEKEVFGDVQLVAALGYILPCFVVGLHGSAFNLNVDGGFLSRARPGFVASGVLMVVGECQLHAVAEFHGGFVHTGAEDNFRGGGLAASAAPGRECEFGDHGALAFQLHGDGAVIVLYDFAVEKCPGFKLGDFPGDNFVLDGIGAVCVKAFVDADLVGIDVDISLLVRGYGGSVECDFPDDSVGSVLLPRAFRQEHGDGGAGKPVILPFAGRGLEGDDHAAFLLVLDVGIGKCGHGGRLGVVAGSQRLLLGDIVEAAAIPFTACLDECLFLVTPHIEGFAAKEQFVFLYIRDTVVIHLHGVCVTLP